MLIDRDQTSRTARFIEITPTNSWRNARAALSQVIRVWILDETGGARCLIAID